MKRYLSLVRLDTDGKGHNSSEKTMCHGIIYMQKCNLEPINSKTPNLIKVGEKKNLICKKNVYNKGFSTELRCIISTEIGY